ncbi:hypothetical protein PYH37_001589 [Sinorhizobium numidicum]|uniref:Uncharacterized protein n=1 Tax=Sinorhizobium numidicum TaxID=680248 RepID=A0ABY8CS76_9HYPH|nr:hypothetical protein [Sinorhizobium numidicum]WEX74200.1 hypothetical protein PYH37_001589 [Sinorhizobium numidicum]WEX80185.1 hypothetical protein PYH38_001590 [Sinorhizobium numidicum]
MTASESGRYWRSLAALAIVLPTAIAVHSWSSLKEWRARHGGTPAIAETGQAGAYAGAQWRLVNLKRLPGPSDDARVILVEFEAHLDDPAVLSESPCQVRLTDAAGRQWEPVRMTEAIVRKMYPEAAERPRCSATASAGAGKGAMVRMAENFIVPAGAKDLALVITIVGARPKSLLLKWT